MEHPASPVAIKGSPYDNDASATSRAPPFPACYTAYRDRHRADATTEPTLAGYIVDDGVFSRPSLVPWQGSTAMVHSPQRLQRVGTTAWPVDDHMRAAVAHHRRSSPSPRAQPVTSSVPPGGEGWASGVSSRCGGGLGRAARGRYALVVISRAAALGP
jgi:hypothetical protein